MSSGKFDKRLSVIIPGFKTPDSLWRRCVESVLRNLGTEDEIICVDDGSPIKPTILFALAENDKRVKVEMLAQNRGLSAARNHGLDVATGRYVTFVDSDDELSPNVYEKAVVPLTEGLADIVVFGVKTVWVSERLYKEESPEEKIIGLLEPEELKTLYKKSLLNYAWNKVYSRDFLDDKCIRFDPNGMPCEDIIFNLQCATESARWASVAAIGITYYRTHGSLLSCYKSSYIKGIRACNEAWCCYKKSRPNAESLGSLGEMSDEQIVLGQWDNLWRLNSPLPLNERYYFLKSNERTWERKNIRLVFLSKWIMTVLRRLLYRGAVQRWYIKRQYPTCKPVDNRSHN